MPSVRSDLQVAQLDAWTAIGDPGPCWSGAQRHELATTALAALQGGPALPPWVAPSTVPGALPHQMQAPERAHDAVYRIAAHAGTLTAEWHADIAAEVGPLAYVELVSLTCTVAAVWSFRRAAGLDTWSLPAPAAGAATGQVAATIVQPVLNWVPVAAPADQRAAVVQAFTALPSEHERIWRLADAQYIPDLEMVDPRWSRGPLSRPQMELVATRVAQLRQCFF
ncbi:MAG: hypothetical protein WCP59_08385 [Actinomycetota bacterium]